MIVLKEILETKCQEKCHIRREKRKSHTPGVHSVWQSHEVQQCC